MYFDGTINVCGNRADAMIISPNKKQYSVLVKLQFGCNNNIGVGSLHSRFRGGIGVEYQKDRYVQRLDFDYFPSERKMANQGQEVETLPRIPV